MAGRLSSFFIVPFIYIHVKYMGLIYSCISYDFFSFLILIFSNLIRLSLISNISYVKIKRPTHKVGQVYTKIDIKPSVLTKERLALMRTQVRLLYNNKQQQLRI